jgi:uncharacterized Fe-S cluster protein YjdI
MRTSVYTFLLTTCLLLTPYAVLAGTDDSGLQVFTVDFSKQLGESADIAQEDTLFSPYCYNMFSSGNGLTTFPEGYGSNYEWTGTAGDIADYPDSYFGAILKVDNTTAADIYLMFNPTFASGTATKIFLYNAARTSENFNMDVFSGGDTTYITVGNGMLSYFASTLATTSVSLPTSTITDAEIFQNRLFLVNGKLLYYSTAQNYENFTVGPTTGGVINVFESGGIRKIISTKYGLYIFAVRGIFLLSGQDKNSWRIEKISNLQIANLKSATVYQDIIYFTAISNELNNGSLWVLNGIDIQPLSDIPGLFFPNFTFNHRLQIFSNGNFLALATKTVNGTSLIFDLNKKTWIRNSDFNVLGSTRFYIKKTSSGHKIYEFPQAQKFLNYYSNPKAAYLNPMQPWAYQTSWMTLDGNASNRKEIDRVEFDYQGGTVAVSLYYAYGNGSSSGATTTLTAPTNTRLSTYVWNAPIGRQQSNRFYLYFLSSGTQTMTTNYILKQARIYYRNIGNYKTNSLR